MSLATTRDDADPRENELPDLFNVEVEQALIGYTLIDEGAFWKSVGRVVAEDFYDPMHQRLWADITARKERGEFVSPLALRRFAETDPGMRELESGGPAYLTSLARSAPAIVNVAEHSRIIRDHAQRRRMVAVARRMIDDALTSTEEPSAISDRAAEDLYLSAHGEEAGDGPRDIEELVRQAALAAEHAHNNPAAAVVPTGLPPIDRELGELVPGRLYALGAISGAGKTGLLQQISNNVARQEIPTDGKPIRRVALMFSKEMPAIELGARYLAREARVPSHRVESGKFSDAEFDRIASAPQHYAGVNLAIDDASSLSVAQIRARAIAHRRRKGRLDLIGIDHLGFITAADRRAQERERLDQITKDLKRIATDLHVPVLLISHINSDFKERKNKRPLITDLYGASAIYKNADDVWMLFREEYFLAMERPASSDIDAYAKWAGALEKAKGKAEVFNVKRRGGPLSSAILGFDAPFVTFTDPDDNQPVTKDDLLALTGR